MPVPPSFIARLPHPAGIHRHHGLTGFTAESLAKLRHILHYAVHPELPGRMRIGLHLQAELLRAGAAAPTLPVSEEELLHRSIAVLLLCQVNALPLGIGQKRDVSQTQAAIVGGVLAQRQLAVYLHVIDRDEVAVLLHFAVRFLVKVFAILGGPPVREVAVTVELAAFVIEAVGEFMSYDAANVAIVRRVRCVTVIQRRLKDASREVDIIGTGVVISVDRRRSNEPLPAIYGLADLCQLAPVLEIGGAQRVPESVVPRDNQIGIVSPVVGIPDLVSHRTQLFSGPNFGGG